MPNIFRAGIQYGTFQFRLQRTNSVSPAEREKYRSRSPVEIEDSKRRKEEKLTNVST